MTEWIVKRLSDSVEITAENEALWICGAKDLIDEETESQPQLDQTRLGKLLPVLIPQLVELDLASLEGSDLRIKYSQFSRLREFDIDAFDELFTPSPFTLQVKTQGSLGFASNNYKIDFYLDTNRVFPEVRGCLLKYDEKIFLLDRKSFELVRSASDFNESSAEVKQSPGAFRQFAEIKDLAAQSNAATDRFIQTRQIITPDQIGVELVQEAEDRISFVPKIDGVDNENFKKAFKSSGSAKEIYSFDGEDNSKITVVLNDEQREAVERMVGVRHVSGFEKAKVLQNPQAIFDGVMASVNLDDFGPRVRGIGDFPFVVQPFLQKSVTGIFDDVVRDGQPVRFNAGLNFRYADGTEDIVNFESAREVGEFSELVNEAFRSGKGQIEYAGKTIAVDKSLFESVRELTEKLGPKQPKAPVEDNPELTGGRYLLIYTNEEEVDFEQDADDSDVEWTLELPRALKPDVVLKEHQKNGVAWLQHNFKLERQGCLLADDMGLGKTLQLLIFLAWLIEQNNVVSNSADPARPPWKPILIIAPVILIENETWISDMKKFFSGDGSIFMPWLTLRGNELKRIKKQQGKETKLGEATLDLDYLREHRVVLTNYETVVNYQHSFAKMRDDWSVIVTDEAQEYKTPNTKVSHALKSLSPRFRVACTGTPVETRLFDVWNIFDFLQPGKLLGSAKNFRDRYEKPLEQVEETKSAIENLKSRLHFGDPSAYILRRDKLDLPDLPQKHEHRIDCELSPTQRDMHLDLLHRASLGGEGNHPFALIGNFLRIYQHPSLVPRYNPASPDQLIEECDKLRMLIEKLRSIKLKREKALIFTRSLDMQQILVSVLNHRFDLSVNIVNGSTKRTPGNGLAGTADVADKTRRGIIEKFRNSPGFDILILSPEVAGMGLTLTEANHVFHYGRWWNPAKEAQATDRVYRIGQEKDVHIYYLIAKDKETSLQTFDEKLDVLLSRRLALASDFLAPIPTEDDLTGEFMADLFGA